MWWSSSLTGSDAQSMCTQHCCVTCLYASTHVVMQAVSCSLELSVKLRVNCHISLVTTRPMKDQDQPVPPQSLTRAFIVLHLDVEALWKPLENVWRNDNTLTSYCTRMQGNCPPLLAKAGDYYFSFVSPSVSPSVRPSLRHAVTKTLTLVITSEP